jgi:hypothetical protein
MAQFLNHNSFLILLLILWGAAAARLLRQGLTTRAGLLMAGLTLLLVLVYAFFRPNLATSPDTAAIRAQIGQGKPVLLEFQSPY